MTAPDMGRADHLGGEAVGAAASVSNRPDMARGARPVTEALTPAVVDQHRFVASDRRDPIDRHYCRVCGLHRGVCEEVVVAVDDAVPLPPEPVDLDY